MEKSKMCNLNIERKPVVDIIGMHIMVLYNDDNIVPHGNPEKSSNIIEDEISADEESRDSIMYTKTR